MSQLQQQYLDAMGITLWQRREMPLSEVAEPETPDESPATSVIPVPEPVAVKPLINDMDWPALQQAVSQCQLCHLHNESEPPLFAIGNLAAEIMVIGEGHGVQEATQGGLLAGDHGALLAEMLAAIGIGCTEIYYTNLIKCRRPEAGPSDSERLACSGYLKRQIELLQPKYLLVLGEQTAQLLLDTDQSLASMRVQSLSYGEQQLPLIATYSPANLLMKPLDKRHAWHDLCRLQAMLSQTS